MPTLGYQADQEAGEQQVEASLLPIEGIPLHTWLQALLTWTRGLRVARLLVVAHVAHL